MISLLADYSSLVGFVISIASLYLTYRVFVDVKRIESNYKYKANAPRLIERLEEHQKAINGYLNDFESNKAEAEVDIKKMNIVVGSLAKLLGKTERAILQPLSIKLVEYGTKQEKQNLREIYLDVIGVVEELKESQEVRSWER